MPDPKQIDEAAFEEEVREVARNLWPDAAYRGAQVLDGRQHDGVFPTEDCIHLVESTVSQGAIKARDDIKKMVNQAEKLRVNIKNKTVQCWFVTRAEPTADQRNYQLEAEKRSGIKVNAVSFRQFQNRLVDGSRYLNVRQNYPFGSVRDPTTGAHDLRAAYVPTELVAKSTGRVWPAAKVLGAIRDGERIVLLGDYGAGKSMALRDLFGELRKAYLTGKSTQFPIHINLRDHWGQTDAAEVLERHARRIGFDPGSHLVRAWRAGLAILLIDGFDELASAGVASAWRKLRDARYRTMQAVREFMRDSPPGTGIVLAGRAQFFDSADERQKALSLQPSVEVLEVSDFTEEQISEYMTQLGSDAKLPAWIPPRPLLVSYLAARDALPKRNAGPDATDPAVGWDELLDRICEREAQIEAGLAADSIRQIIERTATFARGTPGGLGPITEEHLVEAFKGIVGISPDEQALVLLQRLPGLGASPTAISERMFVDGDFADAAAAGDVVSFVLESFDQNRSQIEDLERTLGELGVEVCSRRLERQGVTDKQIYAAIARAEEREPVLVADLARLALLRGSSPPRPILVAGVELDTLRVDQETDGAWCTFADCCIKTLTVEPGADGTRVPRFQRCLIGELAGRVSFRDLPAGMIDSADAIAEFGAEAETTTSILKLELPLPVRVLLTILKKLFAQRGSGRKENALFRGLDGPEREFVPSILDLIEAERIASPSRRPNATIWVPNRSLAGRVVRILSSPSESQDPLVRKAANLETSVREERAR